MLIIGYGNRDRGDDAAGMLVVDRLSRVGINAVAFTGDCFRLMDYWDGESDVVLIDAVVTRAPVGYIHVFGADQLRLANNPATSTHGLGLADIIQLAEQLGRVPRSLRIYGIEGQCFDIGSGVSPQVTKAAETLALQIENEYGARLRSVPCATSFLT